MIEQGKLLQDRFNTLQRETSNLLEEAEEEQAIDRGLSELLGSCMNWQGDEKINHLETLEKHIAYTEICLFAFSCLSVLLVHNL